MAVDAPGTPQDSPRCLHTRQPSLGALCQLDTLLFGQRSHNEDHSLLEQSAAIKVGLGEATKAHTVRLQSIEMLQRLEAPSRDSLFRAQNKTRSNRRFDASASIAICPAPFIRRDCCQKLLKIRRTLLLR